METQEQKRVELKKAVSLEGFVALGALLLFFIYLGGKLGAQKLINSIFAISFHLLINTCFYIMAIAVIAGALGAFLTEFGILSIFNKLLSPLMYPLYRLPGAAAIGVVTTFISDNPAILTLASDRRFKSMFKRYQLPALTNLGTSFGMGLIVIAFMIGLPQLNFFMAVCMGFLGACVGSVISTRLMVRSCRKYYKDDADKPAVSVEEDDFDVFEYRAVRPGNFGSRFIAALLEGGEAGVNVGMSIIPGVLVICTLITLLTNQPDAELPGVALIPFLASKIEFLIKPLFGFTSGACISVPLTALGSAGAAIGIVPNLVDQGLAGPNDIAVFTAMCMCWSGYLSTHVAMMDNLKLRELTGSAIKAHTIGGLAGGVAAHWLYILAASIF
ncbi:MAG: hypothetical protein Q4P08_01305 [Eubacteriales bacterium]|nr:hypothetical protein [Eubacteriales bacterium]